MQAPPLSDVFRLFLRIGNTTFGGGDPTMAALRREMADRRKWITEEQFGLSYSLARLTPGTNVLAFSAGAAWMVRGWAGAVAAVAGSSVPSALLAVWLVHAHELWLRNTAVQAMVGGMVAAVAGMMAAGVLTLFRGQWARAGRARALTISGIAALLTGWAQMNPAIVIALAVGVGLVWKEPAAE